ncbi:sigma factor-like helix-turn-helix DNA-binding protein [Glaciibacter flavus]|nr:sigma factor-like helix-turn-helix DNA-binding protein [Glaciibacter flavus]
MAHHIEEVRWLDVLPWLDREGGTEWLRALPSAAAGVPANLLASAADFAITRHSAWRLSHLFPSLAADLRLDTLGLSVRASNIFVREGIAKFGELGPLSIRDLFLLRSSGALTVQGVVERLISVAVRPTSEKRRSDMAEPALSTFAEVEQRVWTTAEATSVGEALHAVAIWNSALGLWDAPLVTASPPGLTLPPSVEAAQSVLSNLTAGAWFVARDAPPALSDVLARHLALLSEKELVIVRGRVLAKSPQTLDQIGKTLGVTRERIRQIESKVMTRIASWVDDASDLGLFSLAIRAKVHRLSRLASMLEEMPQLTHGIVGLDQPAWFVLDRFDDSFESDGTWIAEPSIDELRAETALRFQAAEIGPGLAPMVSLRESTMDWTALNDGDLEDWLEDCGYRPLEGHFLAPSVKSVPDLAASLLQIRGVACSLDDIHSAVVADRSIGTLQNALNVDPRFVRLDRSDWGLSEWGAREYTGIRDAIELIVQERGSITIDELISDLTSSFTVSPRSILAYASAWPFALTDGVVQMAAAPKVVQKSLSQTRNVYRVGPDAWALRIEVSGEHLRGSGSPLPSSLAAALGMMPGDRMSVESPHGPVTLSWMTLQPSLGSIRTNLLEADPEIGSEVLMTISKTAISFSAPSVDGDRIRRARSLMGLPDSPELIASDVAVAVGLSSAAPWSTVVHVLRDRGESDLASLLVEIVGHNPAYDLPSKLVAKSKYSIVSIEDH